VDTTFKNADDNESRRCYESFIYMFSYFCMFYTIWKRYVKYEDLFAAAGYQICNRDLMSTPLPADIFYKVFNEYILFGKHEQNSLLYDELCSNTEL